jgi:hypothetical protein
MTERKEIENPWVIFYQNRSNNPQIGYITAEVRGILEIKESESQDLPRAYIPSRIVNRYRTIDQTIEEFSRLSKKTFEEVLLQAEEDFPSEF